MRLVIASQNLHKVREFKTMLKEFEHFDIYSLRDFPDYTPLPEEGESFEEIAKTKAIHAAKELDSLVIADDSGLVVPALDGAPGIFSARYAGENATDGENRIKLLSEMKNLKEHQRVAYFECAIAVANPDGLMKCVKGYLEGTIMHEERGANGFGYDPLFVKYDYNKTLAELEERVKNRISHRSKALDKLLHFLQQLEVDAVSH
ncbi:MAG: XTP/dITP diphosphatase [Simkaniaceae bacterium]|nr:XTP/dITP diphosphatase [Simkaniaceae bacterium]